MKEILFRFWIDNKPVIKSLSSFIFNDGTKENTLDGFANPFNIDIFTGLTDKNNNRIFTNDIILDFTSGITRYFIVGFGKGCFDIRNKYQLKNNISGVELYQYNNECEIIGNLYENEILLKNVRFN